MEKYTFLIWISALLPLIIGFFASRITFLKKTRFVADVLVLCLVFLFDLMDISFKWDINDIILFLFVMTILMKFVWCALNMKVRIFKYFILGAGLIIYIFQIHSWLFEKPELVFAKRFPASVEHFSNKTVAYSVKYFRFVEKRDDYRTFLFFKDGPLHFLEKKLDQYSLKNSYLKSSFRFKFEKNGNVTIIGDNDTLWTLKEVH